MPNQNSLRFPGLSARIPTTSPRGPSTLGGVLVNLRLKIVRGKPKGHILTFPDGEFLFGRGPECDIRPNSDLVSRQHCKLQIRDRNAVLRDLGSRNGTLINGQRLIGEIALSGGDTLQIGPLTLEVLVQPLVEPVMDTMMMVDTLAHPIAPDS